MNDALDVVLVAARTTRSQAYAQSVAAAGLTLKSVVLFGDYAPLPAIDWAAQEDADSPVFLPDLTIPLEQTCLRQGWEMWDLDTRDVNEPEIADTLDNLAPKLVVYSGYGGQIVGADLIAKPYKILHMHPGWLPDFRGSTTIYYSWLSQGVCAVSAFYMAEGIDTGEVVWREKYPLPPGGINVDHVYDNAIRADTLVRVLQDILVHNDLPSAKPQMASTSGNYYVIHPLLKHLALCHQQSFFK